MGAGGNSQDVIVVGVKARLVPGSSYSDCAAKPRSGAVEAISTGDLVLAGFAAPDRRIVNAPFSDERYGVGMRKDDADGCEAVNRAITTMYEDGTAGRLLDKWFGESGLALVREVPEFEGCS